jgi:transposase
MKYRYTQDSRRKLLDIKKNQAQLKTKKQSYLANDFRTIETCEAEGIITNSKTCHFNRFLEYLSFKHRLNFNCKSFYAQKVFRRQRLAQYSKKQQANMKLLKEFKQFHRQAEPCDVVVAIGDWEQTIHRGHEPTKGKGIRAVLERAGYHVYLIDEYRTSKMCSKCSNTNAQCEKFRQVPNPRPYRQGQILRHGLVRCTSCWTMWNRDVNAAVNMWKIAKAILAGQQLPPNHPDLRPVYLRRNANANN